MAETLEGPCSPATPPSPEYHFNVKPYRFVPVENHPQTPSITHLLAFNHDLESAFSRLALSPDSRSPPPWNGGGATGEAVSPFGAFSVPVPYGENQHSSYWGGGAAPPFLGGTSLNDAVASFANPVYFPAQSSSAIADGHVGFPWAHQKIKMGPWFPGSDPYIPVDDRDRLMNIHQRQDFSAPDSADFDYPTILHGQEQNSRTTLPILPFSQQGSRTTLPILPFSQQGNFGTSGHSFYSNPEIMRGRIVSLAKDQKWCGLLNLTMEEGFTEQEIDVILPEVLQFSGDLMRNQFGSQFVLKLFVACNEDQKTKIILSLISYPSNFINLCLNTYGARAIQKLLEKLMVPRHISFVVASLVPGAFNLSTDPNGQHVIQQCVKKFSSEFVKSLVIEIANNCYYIGTNKSGCCVIQSCVENSSGEARKRLVNEIIANAVHLAEDPYGNYVVQHLLGMNFPDATAELMRQFRGRFVSLSCNKFASNVVEKFLVLSGENISTMIIMELLQNASMLFLDPYGNFVIQKALSVSQGPIFDALKKLIKENASSMQSNIYGKKILEWFHKNKDYHA